MVRRLARRQRSPPPKSLRLEARSPAPPIHPTAHRRRKKRPSLGTTAAICEAWHEAAPPRSIARRVARELQTLTGYINPHHLTPLHFTALVARWKEHLSAATVYAYRNHLKKLVHHIGALADRPDLEKQIPRVRQGKPRTTIAAPGEVTRIIAVAEPWLRCAIALAAWAGLRRSDCLHVAPVNYNAETRTLTLTQQKTGNPLAVPVVDALAAILDTAPGADDPNTPFLALYAGRPVTWFMLDKAWRRARAKANANPQLTFHDLRRTIAVSLYEVSKDLRVVQQMLGHATLATTTHYLEHRDPEKLRPLLAQLWTPKGPVQ